MGFTVALEDIYRETEKAYYIKIDGVGRCYLKEEVTIEGANVHLPDTAPRRDEDDPKYDTVICPAKMERQKRLDNYRLEDIARFWGISISLARNVLIRRGIKIERAYRKG